jgi:hypothetical protein
LFLEAVFERAACGGQRQRDSHRGAVNLDPAHHPEHSDRLAQLRVDDVAKRHLDLYTRKSHTLSVVTLPRSARQRVVSVRRF